MDKITKIQQGWLARLCSNTLVGSEASLLLEQVKLSRNASPAPFELRSCRSQTFACNVTGWSVLNRSHSQSIKRGKLHPHWLDVCNSRLKDRHTNVCVTPVHVANSIIPPYCLVLKLRLSYNSNGLTLISSSGPFMIRFNEDLHIRTTDANLFGDSQARVSPPPPLTTEICCLV